MRGVHVMLAAGLAAVALAAAGCGSRTDEDPGAPSAVSTDTATDTSRAALPKLIGTVGSSRDADAFEISLRTEDGAEVTTTLPPGTYRLEIADRSAIHNFHLRERDGGLDVASEIAGTGEETVTIVLPEPGSYIYACDAHPDRMRETFSIHDRIRTEN